MKHASQPEEELGTLFTVQQRITSHLDTQVVLQLIADGARQIIGCQKAVVTATLLNQKIRGQGLWRTLYYLPAVLPAATALLWRWMFAQNGLINGLLKPFLSLAHLGTPGWFSDEHLVLPSYVIMGLWGVFGANTIILLAGLKNVPRNMYEAADIDGAGRIAKYIHVTVPMLSATLFYILIMGIDGANVGQVFWSIMLPLVKPALLAIAVLSFQGNWNNFQGPLIYLNTLEKYPMILGLQFFGQSLSKEAPKWHYMMAMSTIMAAPILGLFFIAQRYFIEGLTVGAVKG